MRSYFDKNRENKDLGSWDDFIKELWGIYGQLDEVPDDEDDKAAGRLLSFPGLS